MAHAEFLSYGEASTRLIEECSELIKALCKAKRFGYDSRNPYDPDSATNLEDIYDEISDVELAIKIWKEERAKEKSNG